jgi:hypothetical protein
MQDQAVRKLSKGGSSSTGGSAAHRPQYEKFIKTYDAARAIFNELDRESRKSGAPKIGIWEILKSVVKDQKLLEIAMVGCIWFAMISTAFLNGFIGLQQLQSYDLDTRPTPKQLLEDPYFAGMEEEIYLPGETALNKELMAAAEATIARERTVTLPVDQRLISNDEEIYYSLRQELGKEEKNALHKIFLQKNGGNAILFFIGSVRFFELSRGDPNMVQCLILERSKNAKAKEIAKPGQSLVICATLVTTIDNVLTFEDSAVTSNHQFSLLLIGYALKVVYKGKVVNVKVSKNPAKKCKRHDRSSTHYTSFETV